jgi:hypothetical protein
VHVAKCLTKLAIKLIKLIFSKGYEGLKSWSVNPIKRYIKSATEKRTITA